MKRSFALAAGVAAMTLALTGCIEQTKTADKIQAEAQERILQEGTSQTGMPAITNFRERKLLKMILELRDQDGLVTYTYTVNRTTGRPVFLCNSMGYAISDATGYTNPERIHEKNPNYGYAIMPQAEPNGLFTPDNSTANWVMCLDKEKDKPVPVFVQTDVIVSPVKLD